MALVRGVISGAMEAAVIAPEFGSTSAKIGLAPSSTALDAVAVKVRDVLFVVQDNQQALEEVVALAVALEELGETPRVIQGRALRELQHKQVFPHLQVMVTTEALI